MQVRLVAVMMLASWLLTACGQSTPDRDAGLARADQSSSALDAKRQRHAQELAAMSPADLASALAADSRRGVEPFNSVAYREAVARGGRSVSSLSAALSPDAASLLALLAIRKISQDDYRSIDSRLRADILIAALRNARYFNAWGLPHLFWEDAARAVIDEGTAIEPALRTLLSDRRAAPVWGSEGAAEARRYAYRVCDYAWALINAIRGSTVTIPVDPQARDALIAASR